MKKLEMIIRPEKLEDVKDVLNTLNVHGMTVTMATGCGLQKGRRKVYRGTEFSMNLLPKVKVEVVMRDDIVTEAIGKISEKIRTGEIGDGKIFVYNVENSVRIRTGESGNDAV